jgi:pyroglutamyl-peptidase
VSAAATGDAGAILVAGFGPFGEVVHNPSAALAEALACEPGVRAEVLPVAYARVERRLEALLEEPGPSALLLFGVHRGPGFRLERVALNVDDESAPDVDGCVRRGRPIRPGGPAAYWSTLPLADIGEALDRLGLAWEWSSHAGGFLCNHTFYTARHRTVQRGRPLPCGLVHVPPLAFTPLAAQVIAARACLDTVREAASAATLS